MDVTSGIGKFYSLQVQTHPVTQIAINHNGRVADTVAS